MYVFKYTYTHTSICTHTCKHVHTQAPPPQIDGIVCQISLSRQYKEMPHSVLCTWQDQSTSLTEPETGLKSPKLSICLCVWQDRKPFSLPVWTRYPTQPPSQVLSCFKPDISSEHMINLNLERSTQNVRSRQKNWFSLQGYYNHISERCLWSCSDIVTGPHQDRE